jgi:hypothetical protein
MRTNNLPREIIKYYFCHVLKMSTAGSKFVKTCGCAEFPRRSANNAHVAGYSSALQWSTYYITNDVLNVS